MKPVTSDLRGFLGSLLLAAPVACYGGVSSYGDDPPNGSGADSGLHDDEEGPTRDEATPGELDPEAVERPAPANRFARLSHAQWENTVRDLLGLDERLGVSTRFRADAAQSGYLFGNDSTSLKIDEALWSGYRQAATEVAEFAVSDPQVRATLRPAELGDDDAARDRFIRDFGLRAFRRPLHEPELARYAELFDAAEGLYEDTQGFDAGVRVVVESMLQSPLFLYRIEASAEPDADVIPLDGYEIAQRLSYFLWDTMPDAALFAAAGEQRLHTAAQVEDQARRMLADPRARDVVRRFHDVVFESERMADATPAPSLYPDAPAALGELARAEFRAFVEATVFDDDAGFRAMLTSTETFVDADLAAVYGISGEFDQTLRRVSLDPQQRRGVLTQLGFLVANASSHAPDPIHRGVFILERLMCASLPPPPDDIPPLPPPEGRTNREVIETTTEIPGSNCAACHAPLINPLGFPFEHYDSTGGYRTEDNGHPVDASSTIRLDGQEIPVRDALDLADALAASPSVHDCYIKHWIEFATGRTSTADDGPWIQRLGRASLDGDVSIQEQLIAIVTSPSFMNRAIEELE